MSELAVTHHLPEGRDAETVVVWLHGFLSDQEGEKAAVLRDAMLQSGRAFTTFDFRAHGKSGGDMKDLTCTGLLADVEKVVDDLADRFRNIVLVGSSMGAWAAAWSAMKWPERITSTVLIAPAFDFVDLLKEEAGAERMAAWEREGTLHFDAGFTQTDLGWNLVVDWESYPVKRLEEGLRKPTLIIQGMHDESCDWRKSVAFVESSPYGGYEVVLLGDGDHRLSQHRGRLGAWVDGHLQARSV